MSHATGIHKSKKSADAAILNYSIDKDAYGYILCVTFAESSQTNYGAVGSTWGEDVERLKKTLPESIAAARRIANREVLIPPSWQLENRPNVRPNFRKGFNSPFAQQGGRS